jgi:hypothetical protein
MSQVREKKTLFGNQTITYKPLSSIDSISPISSDTSPPPPPSQIFKGKWDSTRVGTHAGDDVGVADGAGDLDLLEEGLFQNELIPELLFVLWASLVLQVACSMQHLHGRNMAHRDLKLPNILLDNKWNAKISDLGMVMLKKAADGGYNTHNNNTLEGSMPWVSPEILQGLVRLGVAVLGY